MGERFFDFWRVDVFTEVPLKGNPLAVFPRATGLSKEEMEAVAREMILSETTFVFPPSNPAAHYRNRIFTPRGEIPFAGHPSLGTAFVAALEGLVPKPEGASVVYQELEIGVLPLELLVEDAKVLKVVMTQGDPVLGRRLRGVESLAKALGVRAKDIGIGKLVPQLASTGIPSLQVPLRSLEIVRGLDPDMKLLAKLLERLGPHTVCYAFALGAESRDAHVHARSFAPQENVREDPATGSAAGACGLYLAENGRLPAPHFVIVQGVEIRHRSRIEVAVERAGNKVKVIRVGGHVTPVIRGSLRLP